VGKVTTQGRSGWLQWRRRHEVLDRLEMRSSPFNAQQVGRRSQHALMYSMPASFRIVLDRSSAPIGVDLNFCPQETSRGECSEAKDQVEQLSIIKGVLFCCTVVLLWPPYI
jgi:hypothetical protein